VKSKRDRWLLSTSGLKMVTDKICGRSTESSCTCLAALQDHPRRALQVSRTADHAAAAGLPAGHLVPSLSPGLGQRGGVFRAELRLSGALGAARHSTVLPRPAPPLPGPGGRCGHLPRAGRPAGPAAALMAFAAPRESPRSRQPSPAQPSPTPVPTPSLPFLPVNRCS
jgi:hypothetical protein